MTTCIDYYFAPQSPWSYLGHRRLQEIAQGCGAAIRVLPVDLGGKVFPVSGGLPLAKRAPQRQAYRLVELRRFSEWQQTPINIEPKYFPVDGGDAARLVEERGGARADGGAVGVAALAAAARHRRHGARGGDDVTDLVVVGVGDKNVAVDVGHEAAGERKRCR